MCHKVDYVAGLKIQLQKNIEEVRQDVLSGDKKMMVKIQNHAEKYDLPVEFVKHKILFDNIYANVFAKDPGRQTIHQTLAAEYIKSIPGVEDFEILPASGPDALYVVNGVVGHENEVDKTIAKSIDFHWKYDGIEFFASHKYTKDEGGAQDNQYHDLLIFVRNAAMSSDVGKRFLAIADGPYYQRQDRLKTMNDEGNGFNTFATTTDNLEDLMINDVNKPNKDDGQQE